MVILKWACVILQLKPPHDSQLKPTESQNPPQNLRGWHPGAGFPSPGPGLPPPSPQCPGRACCLPAAQTCQGRAQLPGRPSSLCPHGSLQGRLPRASQCPPGQLPAATAPEGPGPPWDLFSRAIGLLAVPSPWAGRLPVLCPALSPMPGIIPGGKEGLGSSFLINE